MNTDTIRKDIPVSSSVSDIQIWSVTQDGENQFSVTYTVKALVQKGGKGYRIKHAQILLKLDQKPENEAWTYDRIKDAYGASHSTIASIAKRFRLERHGGSSGKEKARKSQP